MPQAEHSSRSWGGIFGLRLFLLSFLELFASPSAVVISLAPVRPMAIGIQTGATEPSYREKWYQGQCASINQLAEPKGQDEADHPRSQSHEQRAAPPAPILGHRHQQQQVENADVVAPPGQVQEKIPIELCCRWRGACALRAWRRRSRRQHDLNDIEDAEHEEQEEERPQLCGQSATQQQACAHRHQQDEEVRPGIPCDGEDNAQDAEDETDTENERDRSALELPCPPGENGTKHCKHE